MKTLRAAKIERAEEALRFTINPSNPNERLLKFLQAAREQQAAVDRILPREGGGAGGDAHRS